MVCNFFQIFIADHFLNSLAFIQIFDLINVFIHYIIRKEFLYTKCVNLLAVAYNALKLLLALISWLLGKHFLYIKEKFQQPKVFVLEAFTRIQSVSQILIVVARPKNFL